jgi:hypothetical protein
MPITSGSNMVLYRNSTASTNVFGASTNCTFSVNTEFIDITTAPTGTYTQIFPTSTSFEISADGFITMDNVNYYTLLGLQKNRTLVNVKFVILNGGGNVSIPAGVTLNFDAGTASKYPASHFAYNATGTTFIITYTY